jgi:hypothetical protein
MPLIHSVRKLSLGLVEVSSVFDRESARAMLLSTIKSRNKVRLCKVSYCFLRSNR